MPVELLQEVWRGGTLSVGGHCTQKTERAFLPVELLNGVSQTGPRPLKVDSGSRGSQPAVKVRGASVKAS